MTLPKLLDAVGDPLLCRSGSRGGRSEDGGVRTEVQTGGQVGGRKRRAGPRDYRSGAEQRRCPTGRALGGGEGS